MRVTAPGATLPPVGLPGLDPALSRLVAVDGVAADARTTRTWHVLDTGDALAEHGIAPSARSSPSTGTPPGRTSGAHW